MKISRGFVELFFTLWKVKRDKGEGGLKKTRMSYGVKPHLFKRGGGRSNKGQNVIRGKIWVGS